MDDGLLRFRDRKYLNLESYRRNGQPVRTPLWFVECGGRLYVRTPDDAGKLKRIRRNPGVRIVVCDFDGHPRGDWIDATARIAGGAEAEEANRLLARKYGVLKRLVDLGTWLRRRDHAVIALEV
ncbi:MAG TPA: PPOX class F420-dependent oxidoreductase [Candidatus Acidoferrales bacterium]|nr:PPOX class F420-dependent oxidoreductase [Candidatus Acidoferrales bacterium]